MPQCTGCTSHSGVVQRILNTEEDVKEVRSKRKWIIIIAVSIIIALGGGGTTLFFRIADVDKAQAVTQNTVEHVQKDIGTMKKTLKSIDTALRDLVNGGTHGIANPDGE